MRATRTEIAGSMILHLERHADERGFFARSFCREEFEALGLNPAVAQCNVSFNVRAGTVRGMHYQLAPSAEAKLVRATRGGIYDAIVDLRPDSPSYRRWIAVELTAENRDALYVPEGCAHGFQTLSDDTEVFYQMSEFYAPDLGRGFRYDDPEIAIDWPLDVSCIAEKDLELPPFAEAKHA